MKAIILNNSKYCYKELIDEKIIDLVLRRLQYFEFENYFIIDNDNLKLKDYLNDSYIYINESSLNLIEQLKKCLIHINESKVLIVFNTLPCLDKATIESLIKCNDVDLSYANLDDSYIIYGSSKVILETILNNEVLDIQNLINFISNRKLVRIENKECLINIKDIISFNKARKYLQNKINNKWINRCVFLEDVDSILIGERVVIYDDVCIKDNNKLLGNTIIYEGAILEENNYIYNSIVNRKSNIKSSRILNSSIGEKTSVGPYSHIHSNSFVGDECKIGNYVEVKNSKIGNKTKASHLIYIGDSEVGDNVNFGCGSITVNYDGKRKNKTIIGNDCFIGCNVNLIAPLKICDGAFIAAGSTITKDIPSNTFSIARSYQVNKINYFD